METRIQNLEQLEEIPMVRPNEDLVSVIIPCYNGERYLRSAIDSVFAQTHSPVEIIVVDDGSTDRSREIVEQYPSIRYIYQQNQGVAVARNHGFQKSTGKYVVFLDQDDRLIPDAIEISLNCLAAFPQCGFAAGTSVEIGEDGNYHAPQNSLLLEVKPFEMRDCYEILLSATETFCPPSVLFLRRELLDAVGGFDTIAYPDCSDGELYFRLARHTVPVRYYRPIVEYRSHAYNTSKNALNMLKGCLYVLDKEVQHFQGNQKYEAAYHKGRHHWKNFFADRLPRDVYYQLKKRNFKAIRESLFFLASSHPQIIFRFPMLVLQKVLAKKMAPFFLYY